MDPGDVGHVNPGAGFGPWPQSEHLLRDLLAETEDRVHPCTATGTATTVTAWGRAADIHCRRSARALVDQDLPALGAGPFRCATSANAFGNCPRHAAAATPSGRQNGSAYSAT